ncbi:MAG: aminopeptidase [Anaerolineales bacterium]|jgi:aminopeptidase
MPDEFQQLLRKYAQVGVRVGNNLQPGQRLIIIGKWLNRGVPLELAPLVHEIEVAAYQAGAPYVDVIWADQQTDLLRFKHAPEDSFEEYPEWFLTALLEYMERGDAMLEIFGEDPQLLKDQDGDRINLVRKTAISHLEPALKYVTGNIINWTIIGAPVQGWADMVFPDAEEGERVDLLWQAIFKACRIDQPDPIKAWQDHIADLAKRAAHLNKKGFDALHYKGPGTDLTVGLPQGHIWQSAGMKNKTGIPFTANIPTEEVFSLPHRERADGVIASTKPLSYAGSIIEDFQLTFEAGKVVDLKASRGEKQLRDLIETDENAARLGEVALVPFSSPISQSGLLFFNTLYDENAACHIALGRGIRACLQDGTAMEDEAFVDAGGNTSQVHVDFMVGSNELDIDGLTAEGTREPVLRDGEWAF